MGKSENIVSVQQPLDVTTICGKKKLAVHKGCHDYAKEAHLWNGRREIRFGYGCYFDRTYHFAIKDCINVMLNECFCNKKLAKQGGDWL